MRSVVKQVGRDEFGVHGRSGAERHVLVDDLLDSRAVSQQLEHELPAKISRSFIANSRSCRSSLDERLVTRFEPLGPEPAVAAGSGFSDQSDRGFLNQNRSTGDVWRSRRGC